MADHSVAMFIERNGEKVQVGWASPIGENGGRTFEKSAGFEDVKLAHVTFSDEENFSEEPEGVEEPVAPIEVEVVPAPEPTPEAPVETETVEADQTAPETADPTDDYPQAGDEGKDSAPLQVEPNEELAAAPVENVGEETVELDNGGEIVDVAEAPVEVTEDGNAERVAAYQKNQNRNKNRNRNANAETRGNSGKEKTNGS